ncbi:MAG: hypothetical protein J6M03_04095 [Clostridia bacterium]|nr:hypothetical protein [Clostridia bacterium]
MSSTNKQIYQSALGLIGELNDPMLCEDYEERAPYILASFCSLASEIDKKLRIIDSLDAGPSFSHVCLSLDAAFPLCDRLSPAASLYLAAMLVLGEDDGLSDSLYDKYCDAISSIASSVGMASSSDSGEGESSGGSAICESISERYFFD